MTATASTTGTPSPKLQAIRALTAAGRVLIPLNGKRPIPNDWPTTKPGQYDELELLAGNYGVVLQDGELVIDVDPRNFAPGDRPLERLVADAKLDLSNSFVVVTGGGGLHIYLSIPAGVLVRNDLKAYPGIEFKALGRQVAAPFSIHPDTGKPYTVRRGTPSVIVAASETLVSMIERVALPFAEVGVKEWVNDAGTQGRYAAYLQDGAEPSIEGQGGDHNAFKVAVYGRDLGLSPGLVHELMLEIWNPRCKPEWTVEELRVKVVNAYKYAAGAAGSANPQAQFTPIAPDPAQDAEEVIAWSRTAQGQLKKTFNNLLNYLRSPNHGLTKVFGHNEFTGQVEFMNPAPWHRGIMPRYPAVQDNDLKLLKGFLVKRHDFEANVGQIEEAVVNTAHAARFHPVREYLNSLKWDEKPRLDHWLTDYLGAEDSAYVRAIARKTICAAVMRVMKPGIKFDQVLVLEGGQGIGKSTVVKILGGKWAGDFQIDPHKSADTVQLMQGKWFVELPELVSIRKADNDATKAFFSRDVDKARLAYGRLATEYPRQCVFIGSYNPSADGTYLSDESGNRRWWPVKCDPLGGRVDFAAFKEARNHLFAEAVHLVKTKGEKLYMDTAELEEQAQSQAAARHGEHPWTERIAQWIAGLDGRAETKRDFLTAAEVFRDALLGIDRSLDGRTVRGIARAMRECGWHPGFARINARTVRGYSRGPVVSSSEKKEEKISVDLLASIR
jgi:predicted P-loop ATPase